jgi:uncharacterized protein YegJ (DUF2314 family)
MRSFLVLILGLVFGLMGCTPAAEPVSNGKPVAPVEVAQPGSPLKLSSSMRNAIVEARKELPTFWKAWEDGSWGKGDYIVSAQFMSEDGERGEFLWISVQARGEGEVTGMMEGQPEVRSDMKHGSVVTVKESDIVDWMYVPEDGDHKGGYTLKALGDPVK